MAGNLDAAESEQGRHDVLRVHQRLQAFAFVTQSSGKMPEHRDADRFLIGLLFLVGAMGADQVAVVGGEDDDGVVLQAGLLK